VNRKLSEPQVAVIGGCFCADAQFLRCAFEPSLGESKQVDGVFGAGGDGELARGFVDRQEKDGSGRLPVRWGSPAFQRRETNWMNLFPTVKLEG